jgi:hypothetical protein
MQVPLLALAGIIFVELALGGTPRILFMELLRRRTCGARRCRCCRCLPGASERRSKAIACRALTAPDRRLGGPHRLDQTVKFRT